MYDYSVTIRHYDDKSISIHARKDQERRPEFFRKWAISRPDVNSIIHNYLREGRLCHIEFFMEDLTRREAAQIKDILVRNETNNGYRVLNNL